MARYPDEIASVLNRINPDTVVISLGQERARLPTDDLLDVRFAGVPIEEATALYEQAFGRVCVDRIDAYQLILSTELGPQRWTIREQTIYSLLIALIAAIITGADRPNCSTTCKLTSPGP